MKTYGELAEALERMTEQAAIDNEKMRCLRDELEEATDEITRSSQRNVELREQNRLLLVEQGHEERVRKELQQRAERAEAAVEEMRKELDSYERGACELLTWATQLANDGRQYALTGQGPFTTTLQQWFERDHTPEKKWGHGWLSPEKRQQAVEALKALIVEIMLACPVPTSKTT